MCAVGALFRGSLRVADAETALARVSARLAGEAPPPAAAPAGGDAGDASLLQKAEALAAPPALPERLRGKYRVFMIPDPIPVSEEEMERTSEERALSVVFGGEQRSREEDAARAAKGLDMFGRPPVFVCVAASTEPDAPGPWLPVASLATALATGFTLLSFSVRCAAI